MRTKPRTRRQRIWSLDSLRTRVVSTIVSGALLASAMVFGTTTLVSSPAQAETSATGAPIYSNNTFYAYANSGETLNLSFVKAFDAAGGGTATTFRAFRPDGSIAWTCTVAATAALGASCANANVPVNVTGAWKIAMGAAVGGTSTFNWNIRVNAAGLTQTGRVWVNQYNVLQSDGVSRNLTYYMVNDSGYQYTTILRGYNGIGSTIRANSLGLASTGECIPSYQSRDNTNVAGLTITGCGKDFRIFFQSPSSSLPASAPSADGRLVVLPAPLTDADLAVTNLAFAPTTTNAATGRFTYSINPRFTGSYQLQIDTDGNGSYTDAVDRRIDQGADGSGAYDYTFDGLDGRGNAIADCSLMNARIYYDSVGEMHVVQSDVEDRAGGIQITRTNGPGAPSSTVYWDDRAINPALHANGTPRVNGTAGVNSEGGVHGWDGTTDDSWGNESYVDDWTYRPVNLGTGAIAIGGQCLVITKTADRVEVVPGDTITYTVSVQNTGDFSYTAAVPASFTDDLSEVLDDATYNNNASGGATYAAPTLSWSGPLASGATKTVTYSVTVNDPPSGDQRLTNAVLSDSPGSNCAADSDDPRCIVRIPAGAFTVAKTASATQVSPGDTVSYTVTVTNTGETPYTAAEPASFSDDLAPVLDDSTYNNDATNGATVTGTTLSWSGALAVGASATITYSVTVADPDTGDKTLVNTVRPTSPGGFCDPAGECSTTTLVATYTVAKTSDAAGTVTAGQVVTYSVTVVNTGTAAYTDALPASLTDDLSAVLDDATYNNDASGGAVVTGNTLAWSGPLAVGAANTITYSVTIGAAGSGDGTLTNAVVPDGPGGECETDGGCTTTNLVQAYTVAKTSSATAVDPGDAVTYSVTVTNVGQVAYPADAPASFEDDLAAVLDDAVYNNDATNGATVTGSTLNWAGALAVGESVTVTYSVTVNNPDLGDHTLTNAVVPTGPGGACEPEACTTVTPVRSYTAAKTADTSAVVVGDTITYTITLTNTGGADYTAAEPAMFTDDLSAVLDDATYNNDASNGASYAAPTLSWSGPLAVGATQTITYSVHVNAPKTGDSRLRNSVVTGPGGNCASDSTDPTCTVELPTGSFTVAKEASATQVNPGDEVTYTVTVTNTGQVAYTAASPASFSDDLTAVLDDATYNGDADNGAEFTSPTLSWSGALAVGRSITITYSVTVNDPDTGDNVLDNAVVPTSPGGSCDAAAECTTSTPVQSYTVAKTSAPTGSVLPGGTVTYTVTVTNTGAADYTAAAPATLTDTLSEVLDDATYNNDATSGAVVTGDILTWSGALAVGATVSITYSVTVGAAGTGDGVLTNAVSPTTPGGSCATDDGCVTTTPIQSYTVSKTSDASGSVLAGDVITYTVTVTNTGAANYTAAAPASLTDDLSAVLDDATYNNDVTSGATVTGSTLSWSGALAVGTPVTITYSVTVAATGTGDGVLTNAVVPTGPGGVCDPDEECSTTNQVQSFTVAKAASTTQVGPGGVVTYTVTVTNTGQVDYTAAAPASFDDDLSAVLDDAAYNNDATNGAGVAGNTLSWSGALAAGASVTITYSVTVDDPDAGDHVLTNAVVPTTPGGECVPGECETTTPVQSFTATKTADTADVVPGDTITYTITVTNTGAADYTAAAPATFTDDLSGVLDDATYNNDATSGASYAAPTLTWSGPLAVGATQTITYTVTVNDPQTGDSVLPNAIVTGPGGNCPPDSDDPACNVELFAGSFTVAKSASATQVIPGDTVTYSVTVTNIGQVDYTAASPASFTDNLTAVLDDATYNGDVDNGATYAAPTISWSGALAVGESVTVTYSVTVNDPDTGDHVLDNAAVPTAPGGVCDPAAECATSTPVQSYTVAKTSAPAGAVLPGDTVTYTVTVTNTGAADYTAAAPATLTDTLSEVLDDATYNNDATSGAVVTDGILSWSGALAVGTPVTITYSVTVGAAGTGDGVLTNAVSPTTPGGSCATEDGCVTTNPVQSYSVSKTSDPSGAVVAGDVITYTVTVTNTGAANYTAAAPASLTDDLSAVLDDATYNNDVTSGASVTDGILSWSGALAVGTPVTITYSVTVGAAGTGDGTLTNAVVPTSPGGECDPDGECTTTNQLQSYTVAKTSAPVGAVLPGGTVTYTVTVTNTGAVDYTAEAPATLTDTLSEVLDDATYNNDATSGAVVTDGILSWSGALAVGTPVTITYSVTVGAAGTGDGVLTNAVAPTGPGGSCATEDGCVTTNPVQAYSVSKTSSPSGSVVAGDVITYTVTVTNTGAVDYTAEAPASLTDSLAAVLDDATYNNDATSGAVVTDGILSWSGALAVGTPVTITYSVTVAPAGTGDGTLTNAVVPTAPGGVCDPEGECTTTNQLQSFTVAKAASTTQVNPGDVVTYTVTVTNTGGVAYTADAPASFDDDLTAVLDDAAYNNDASNGATVTGSTLAWSGALAADASVTITYSVTVDDPDAGDHVLTNAVVPTAPGGECVPGECETVTPVQTYTVSKSASTTSVVPGDTITYTITVKNTGAADYTAIAPATFSDDLSAVLDDATYNNDATSGASYAAPTLTWSGPLAIGATQTVTYTVTVGAAGSGDGVITNAVLPTAPGGECDPVDGCTTTNGLQSYTVAKTSTPEGAVLEGSTITYTVTVTNTGQVDYTDAAPATFEDTLSAVLDDATYNDDASNGATVTGDLLSWSGALAVGATQTITYSVTVGAAGTGDGVLTNAVVPTTPGGECATEGGCSVTNELQSYTVSKTSDPTGAVVPGDVVTYMVTVTNTGAVDYTAEAPASLTDTLSAVLDDASYNNDATSGATVTDGILSWSGALAVGTPVTITYSVTVAPAGTGDGTLTNAVVPTAPGGECATDGGCSVTNELQSFTVAKAASTTQVNPGDVVTYTVTVTNTGQVDYTADAPASFDDDLTAALDDATYNNDASNGATVTGSTLAWSGALAAGASVTITYSVTVDDPDAGDHVLTNAVVPTAPGGECVPGECETVTPVQSYTVSKTADTTTVVPGDTITYTITVTNTGAADYTAIAPATFSDDLSAVLDDATYNNDATNGATFTAPNMVWAGALAIGATQTVTYTVTVGAAGSGDGVLTNAVLPTAPGGDCDPLGTCTTTNELQSFAVAKTASATQVNPGGTVTYTVTVTNTGQVDYTADAPASFTDDLTAVLDDATYNGDADNGAGYAAPTISWSGALEAGATTTITYSVTVNDPDTGDHVLDNAVIPAAPGGVCDPDAECATSTPVQSYTVAKTSAPQGAVLPGATVTYTVTITNTGAAAYTAATPATFEDDLTAVLDDATYNGDASNGATFGSPTLAWSGALAVGAVQTVTYSVTVGAAGVGDDVLTNAVVPTAAGGDCATDGGCVTTNPVQAYTVAKTSSPSGAVIPGTTVVYTVTVTNTGSAPYTAEAPAALTDDLSAVLDDATYNNDATNGATVTDGILSWSGPLAADATVTITYSVTVAAAGTGDGTLTNGVVPTAPGGECETEGGCATTNPVQAYSVAKVASAAVVNPGGTLSYTITVTNTGQVAYTADAPAAFTDDLGSVLDDAAYNGDVSSGATVTGSTLAWSGALAVGASVDVTYSVTVKKPNTGDNRLENAVVPTAPGGACAAEECLTVTPVQSFTATKTADRSAVVPGDTITYTITVVNTGQADYTAEVPATFSDDLSELLDDASYNDDATNGATYTAPTLAWSGALPVGASETFTYSVTVNDPATGDSLLPNTVVTGIGGNCDVDSNDPACVVELPSGSYSVSKAASSTTVDQGGNVTYTVTVTNTGQVDYTDEQPAAFEDDLSAVLDDAEYNGDASNGATVTGTLLTWSGALPVGAVETITYSVKVDATDVGDKVLDNFIRPTTPGGACVVGECATSTPVRALTVSKTVDSTMTAPGNTLTYTITVTNSGAADYTTESPASFTDDLTQVLDDATYNNDATNGARYSAPVLSWSGALAVGATATVTYTVAVNKPAAGDHVLTNTVVAPSSNCLDDSADAACTVTSTLTIPPVTTPLALTGIGSWQTSAGLIALMTVLAGLVLAVVRRRKTAE
jgi:uncharacterized repeat protein (TIGR01451 family)